MAISSFPFLFLSVTTSEFATLATLIVQVAYARVTSLAKKWVAVITESFHDKHDESSSFWVAPKTAPFGNTGNLKTRFPGQKRKKALFRCNSNFRCQCANKVNGLRKCCQITGSKIGGKPLMASTPSYCNTAFLLGY